MRYPTSTSGRNLAVWGLVLCAVSSSLLLSPSSARGSEPSLTPEQVKFFELKIRPLLAENCFKCHGPDQQKGGLRLDGRGHLLAGGESGAAIIPGNPDESLLLSAVRYESFEMPPSRQLSSEQVDILSEWIKAGAFWPGDDGSTPPRTAGKSFSEEDRAWWAFQPLQHPQTPQVRNTDWCRNEIDYFIASRQEQQNLSPAPEADRKTLIRRVYFDLIGLPPTPDEVSAFVADRSPDAYERLVDRLLDRPQYGERWARHWLDLVRYADSDGYRADGYRPEAWRYRDYVIRSFNDDKPYDRFVQEQLAGDELFPEDVDARIATGYLRHGIYEYNSRDAKGQWDIMQNEITDVTSDVFLGLGLQCARCHDHKFDPLLQKDYYRLRAFFEPLMPHDDLIVATAEDIHRHDQKTSGYEAAAGDVLKRLNETLQPHLDKARDGSISRFPDDLQALFNKPQDQQTPYDRQIIAMMFRQVQLEWDRLDSRLKGEQKEKVLALRRELAKYDSQRPEPLPRPMIVTDVGPVSPPTIIPKRGTEVLPGFPTILQAQPAVLGQVSSPHTTGRRATLARWITNPGNSLTTRVITNRIWQYHFGKGLAENSSDFGRLGAPPTHPELLDYLTGRFLAGGWRFKNLHRLIVTSATYRQSAVHPELSAYQLHDPGNQWYWRGSTHRLDAEQIRDAILAVTGQLDLSRGGPGVMPDQPRRSIYTRIMRNSRDPLLDAFDLPQFFSSTSSRNTTTSPVQSLLLLNSQTMLQYAAQLEQRVRSTAASDGKTDFEQRAEQLWKLVLNRTPSSEELHQARLFLDRQQEEIDQGNRPDPLTDLVTGKMPYRDGQSILFQPEHDKAGFAVSHDERMNMHDFTVEVYFQPRSIFESGEVRTLAAKWAGGLTPGWGLGITGKGSRRKPQTVVLQLMGCDQSGKIIEAALFSDQHVEINKPYYLAACIHLATPDSPGFVQFYLKDLSNDDEPVSVVRIAHSICQGIECEEPLMLGSRDGSHGRFDGLLDDVRLSHGVLSQEQLLLTAEGISSQTVGYWQFEPMPGVFQDSMRDGLKIHPTQPAATKVSTETAAWVDLCHILLNSNEFLYVD